MINVAVSGVNASSTFKSKCNNPERSIFWVPYSGLNYCEFIALSQNFISDINRSLKMLMPNSTSQLSLFTNSQTPTNIQINSTNTTEKYFGNTVLICATFNNRIAGKPKWLRTVRTENSLLPQSYWFTDQTTAVLAIKQLQGSMQQHPGLFCFWTKDDCRRIQSIWRKRDAEVDTLIHVLLAFLPPMILLNWNEIISFVQCYSTVRYH